MARPRDLPTATRWPHGVRARYVCGCRCDWCRAANRVYNRRRAEANKRGLGNPIIDATDVRDHLLRLSAAQVGRRAVHAASGVNQSIIRGLRRGERPRLRKATAERLLAVSEAARAAHALVPAGQTWQRIWFLLGCGWKKAWIAKAIGQHGPLQLAPDFVTAKHQRQINDLYVREWFRNYKPVSILRRFP